jgi:prepilin-type N-terminal cleavage/methylation domain-containing protein
MFRTNKQFQKAFTLVELIVVIVILAILATIAFLSFSSQSASARDSTRLSDMNNIAK